MKVMSVDDSATTRKFVKSAIDLLAFDFVEAGDGRDAQKYLEKNGSVDLILLDWNMPEMDGLTFLKWLKSDDRFKGIPVTMVTTEIERDKVIRAIGEGAKNYVMKPFSQEMLIEKIMDSLGMSF